MEVLTISAKELSINEEIRFKEVRVVADNSEQLGVMSSDEALEKAEECYRSYNKTLGDTDKSTINSLCRIGDILVKLGRHNEAHDIYKACYRKRKETLGEDHPDTQSLLSYLSE